LTNTGHSPSTGGDLRGHALTHSHNGSHYIALVWMEQRTLLPRIPPLLSGLAMAQVLLKRVCVLLAVEMCLPAVA
jgi:hypothetical protein